MHRSIRKFNIPSPATPRAFELLKIDLFKFLPPRSKKAVQMPHQLVLNCLSSKTSLVFNQALYMPFREICRNDTFNLLLKTLSKSYSLTKAKFYLVNPSDPTKTEKIHRPITSVQEINPVQIPPSQGTMHSQMPRVCPGGGGMLKFRIDRHVIFSI